MDQMDTFISLWPLLVSIVMLIIVLAKIHAAVGVLEDKVRTLFDLFNKDDR